MAKRVSFILFRRRAVTKCEVEIIEGDGAPEYFYETWYLAYASAGRSQMHPLVLAMATLLAVAATWPWPDDAGRRQRRLWL